MDGEYVRQRLKTFQSCCLQACLESKAPDSSAAWKAEAEKGKTEADKLKKENKLLLGEMSSLKNALAHQLSEGVALQWFDSAARQMRDD